MNKNEFKHYIKDREEVNEVTISIKGAEKLDDYLFPVLIANTLGQASEGDEGTLVAMLMVVISRIADVLHKEPINFIMELAEMEIAFIKEEC